MAAREDRFFAKNGTYESSSRESNANPEAGLMTGKTVPAYGDTKADLADMQRLGKKQEFEAWNPSSGPSHR